jgi:hypothetical protein
LAAVHEEIATMPTAFTTSVDDGAAGGGIAAEGNRAGCDAGNPGRRLKLGMRQELFYDELGLQFRKS